MTVSAYARQYARGKALARLSRQHHEDYSRLYKEELDKLGVSSTNRPNSGSVMPTESAPESATNTHRGPRQSNISREETK